MANSYLSKAGAKVLLFSDIRKFFAIFFAFLGKKVQNQATLN